MLLVVAMQIYCTQMGVDEEPRLSYISYKWGQLYAPISVTMMLSWRSLWEATLVAAKAMMP
jgi:hypothetical protein